MDLLSLSEGGHLNGYFLNGEHDDQMIRFEDALVLNLWIFGGYELSLLAGWAVIHTHSRPHASRLVISKLVNLLFPIRFVCSNLGWQELEGLWKWNMESRSIECSTVARCTCARFAPLNKPRHWILGFFPSLVLIPKKFDRQGTITHLFYGIYNIYILYIYIIYIYYIYILYIIYIIYIYIIHLSHISL